MFLTALPFAVSVPLTSNEINNFVTGSLPNGTVVQNVDTGQVAIVQNGEPAYLPYLSGVDPSLPVLFMTTQEILSYSGTAGELIQNTDNNKIVVVGSGGVPSYLPYLTEASVIDTSSFMEKPTSTGSVGQVLTRANGSIPYTWADVPSGGSVISGVKTARFVIGTSTAGWTAADCDYLCDGTADQTEINAAITALPATGGEIVILDGTYNITAKIDVTKDNVSIRGNGNATILKRMFDSDTEEGVITLTGRSGCKIANLQIDGNKTSYTNNNNRGIYLDSSSNNTVTGNNCNNEIHGIYLDSSSNNIVTGNTCNNNYYGIYLDSSSNNTVTGNNCNNNNDGINLKTASNNIITGNACIRGTGLANDYNASQDTIRLVETGNSYNLIAMNNCMGKAVTNGGGTGNTLVNNKFDAT